MLEKYMVNDVLSGINNSLSNYANVITQAENPEFRKTMQDIRNSSEAFQYELFKVAQNKGYYQPASVARPEEINSILRRGD